MQPKRLLIAVLVVILITLSAMSISAASDTKNEVAIGLETWVSNPIAADGTSVTVRDQDTIKISVTVGEKSGFKVEALSFTFTYDADHITYVGQTSATSVLVRDGVIKVSYLGDYAEAGTLFTLEFKVNEGAHGDIGIKMTDASGIDSAYAALELTKPETTAWKIGAHQFGEAAVTAPTCTVDGYTTYTCATCEQSVVTDATPATGHSSEGVTSTCTTDGLCANGCGTVVVPMTGHNSTGVTSTCTTDGLCANGCGTVVVPMTGHNSEGVTSTCTTDGLCANGCGTVVVPMTGHKSEGVTSTCTEDGLCANGCGTVVVPMTGHNSEGVTATCTEDGLCANGCGAVVAEKTGHKSEGVTSTCTEDGLCANGCGEVVVEKTGHSYGDWVVETEAKAKKDGSQYKVCSVCQDKVTEVIPATGEVFPWWIIVIVVVVLVGGFACYWFFVKKKKA